MEFEEITKTSKVHPGEYLLHQPTHQIVMCGAYKPDAGTIKAMASGKLIEDKISNFQKIKLGSKERRFRSKRRCGGCKK